MIYSITPFFNELDILEIRLATLDEVVDWHIIVESNLTHSGHEKPLYYLENQERFRPWRDKIVAVAYQADPKASAVHREAEQRRWGKNVLKSPIVKDQFPPFAEGDHVILSDVDEIPDPGTLLHLFSSGEPVALHLLFPMYLYYLNWRWKEIEDTFTICRVFPATFLNDTDLETLRHHPFAKLVGEDAGWHMAYMGGAEAIRYKMQSFLHHDVFDIPEFSDPESIETTLRTGRDIYHRDERKVVDVGLSPLPSYVKLNLDKFRHLLSPEVRP